MQSPRSFWGVMCGAGGLGGVQEEARGAWRGPRRGVWGWRARQGPRRGTGGSLGRGLTLHRATSGGCKPQMPGRQPGVEMFFLGLRRREVKAIAVLLRRWPVSPQGASCSGF